MRFSNINNNHDWELIFALWEEFDSKKEPSKYIKFKEQAIEYIETNMKHLSKAEIRAMLAKIKKLKTSNKKEQRHKSCELAKHIQNAFNH